MDTDDGVEVVWNEVRYSNRKSGRKEMLVKILQRLTEFKHTNIVNFINFWHDRVDNQDRVSWLFTVVCCHSFSWSHKPHPNLEGKEEGSGDFVYTYTVQ